MSNEEKLQKLVKECKKMLEDIGLHVPVDYTFSIEKNTISYLGCCFRKKKEIKISNYLFEFDEIHIKEVIIHEMLHTIAPAECHHKGEWKKYAEYVQSKYPGYRIVVCASMTDLGKTQEEIDKIFHYKYKIVCTKCGNSNSQKRITKDKRKGLTEGGLYRCTKCGNSKFEVIELY